MIERSMHGITCIRCVCVCKREFIWSVNWGVKYLIHIYTQSLWFCWYWVLPLSETQQQGSELRKLKAGFKGKWRISAIVRLSLSLNHLLLRSFYLILFYRWKIIFDRSHFCELGCFTCLYTNQEVFVVLWLYFQVFLLPQVLLLVVFSLLHAIFRLIFCFTVSTEGRCCSNWSDTHFGAILLKWCSK